MEKKTFAFKLADKKTVGGKWKARDGLSMASCTDTGTGDYRANELTFPNGPPCPPDTGYHC